MKQTLNEQVARIKAMMVLKEQRGMTLEQYMDELLKDPIGFLNKLNTDEQFKNDYIKSYGPQQPGNPNRAILEDAKTKFMINNGSTITGQLKNDKTNEIVLNYEISSLDEFLKLNQFIKDYEAKGTPLFDVGLVGLLRDVKNGNEFAQALNIARGAKVFT
jgi:hypothetical protein